MYPGVLTELTSLSMKLLSLLLWHIVRCWCHVFSGTVRTVPHGRRQTARRAVSTYLAVLCTRIRLNGID
jgi:hypothetical protein